MSTKELESFLKLLVEHGWKISEKTTPLALSERLQERYPRIPTDYQGFLEQVASAENKGATAWFLCQDDYNGTGGSAFGWDEFESQSIEAARNEQQLIEKVKEFWQEHLPIAFSVKGEYAFLALCLSPDSFGAVVYGHEPEYEDAEIISSSFDELTRLMAEVITTGPGKDYHDLEDFI